MQTQEKKNGIPRRRRRLSPFFEAEACDYRGDKIRGTAFHRGGSVDLGDDGAIAPSGDAASYRFDTSIPGLEPPKRNPHDLTAYDPPCCQIVRDRLTELLPDPKDVELVWLRLAGWSHEEIAAKWGCDRRTPWRREQKVNAALAADPLLQSL